MRASMKSEEERIAIRNKNLSIARERAHARAIENKRLKELEKQKKLSIIQGLVPATVVMSELHIGHKSIAKYCKSGDFKFVMLDRQYFIDLDSAKVAMERIRVENAAKAAANLNRRKHESA